MTRSTLRAGAVSCGFVLALAAPLPATAQRLVVSYRPDTPTPPADPITQSVDLGRGTVEWTEPGNLTGPLVISADGRYLLSRRLVTSTGPLELLARDLVTRATVALPFNFEPRLAHPTQLAFFGLTGVHSTGFGTSAGILARLDVTGLHPYAGCPADSTAAFDLSGDATTLAALCQSGDVVLLATATGQIARTLTADGSTTINSLLLNGDATAVLVTRRNGTATNEIAKLDAITGSALATTTMGPADAACSFRAPSADRTRAVVGCSWISPPASIAGEARILDASGVILGPALPSLIPGGAAFSPDNHDVFLTSTHRLGFGVLNRYDVTTGAITASSGTITPGPFAVAFTPLAPALTHTLAGTRLDLSWTLPAHSPVATRYIVEAGTAPGLSDIGSVTVGASSTLSLPNAPPGTYVLRVRGANATGIGSASNEITVTVP